MRLIRLRLHNFRQHADSELEFGGGLTGIIGPNGAGKSTILEAIAWAVYGASAARGTNETLRFSRAPARSRVQAELTFELAGHEYRVVRSPSNAEVFLDGDDSPVARSIAGATEYLQARLGMTRAEFFNTYFTGQKELQFLAQMGPAQRGRFLGQVLGYERLRTAQDLARRRRNELRHEIDGLRAGLPDARELRAAREAARSRVAEAEKSLGEAERASVAAAAERDRMEPRWREAQARRERARETAHALDMARQEREAATGEGARAEAELARIAAAEAELAGLETELAGLPDLGRECERFSELARLDERRRALADSEKALAEELAEAAERLEKLDQAPALVAQYAAELETLRADRAAAEDRVEALRAEWEGQKREVETKLRTYRDRAYELKEQIQELRQAGPDGVCPTCERPLGGEFDRVVGNLADEWETLVQDGKWLKQRLDQLQQERPPELVEAERRRSELREAAEDRGRKMARCERAVQERDGVREERSRKQARLATIRAELEGIPGGYDAERHREAEARLAVLRELEARANRLRQTAESRARREKERDAAAAARRRVAERLARLEATAAELAYDQEELAALGRAYEQAETQLRAAELRTTELRGAAATAAEALEAAVRAEEAVAEKRARLNSLELDLRHHNELDGAFSHLRGELNARVRPELSELASRFLAEITDGRYTSLEIDDAYNVLVLDEGEEKPVISGGEEDIANLVLRLAISQMIAERAGHPLSLLILDEVFGSLDLERRDNVIQLLHRLEDRFEQVILITHVETIREGLDRVIRVRFDERSGASRISEPAPPEAVPA